MACLSADKSSWRSIIATLDDDVLVHKSRVDEPDWNCGEARWRLWKRLLVQEMQRRGLVTYKKEA